MSTSVFSVGHSTRSADELIGLLREAGVATLADVRRHPGSRRHPQHARPALETGFATAGIRYVWLGESLGGRVPRQLPAEQSPNRGWTVPAFRNYADGMARPEFQAGFDELLRLAHEAPTAVMCAERLWWQCHRRLLADLLLVRGFRVVHLFDPGEAREHELTPWARVESGRLSYPGLV